MIAIIWQLPAYINKQQQSTHTHTQTLEQKH